MDESQPSNPVYFQGMNLLRAFSALAIIVYHSALGHHDVMPKALKTFTLNLTLGVDMFFIISGFIIIYLLLLEKQSTGKIHFFKFYFRRALRIFPLYFLVIGLAYVFHKEAHPEIDFSKFLYFWSNFWMIEQNNWTISVLNPLWSLCIEEHFYLVIPLPIFLTPLKRVHYVMYGVVIVSAIFRFYIFKTIEWNWMTIYLHTLSRCDLMAIGGLLAWYFLYGEKPFHIGLSLVYAALSQLALVMCIIDFADFSSMTNTVFKKYIFVIPMVILFVGIVLSPDLRSGLLGFLKANRALDYLGKISFGLYMYHSFVSDYVHSWQFLPKSFWVHSTVVIILTICIAALSYEVFEKQILKWKKPFAVLKPDLG